MSKWHTVKLREVVTPAARAETPATGTTYRQIGVKLWGEGAYERESIDGSQTRYAQLFRTEAGDIIVNKIWARNGSVGVVPDSLAGCFGSSEFPMFTPKRELLDPRWIHWLTKTPGFWRNATRSREAQAERIESSRAILERRDPAAIVGGAARGGGAHRGTGHPNPRSLHVPPPSRRRSRSVDSASNRLALG